MGARWSKAGEKVGQGGARRGKVGQGGARRGQKFLQYFDPRLIDRPINGSSLNIAAHGKIEAATKRQLAKMVDVEVCSAVSSGAFDVEVRTAISSDVFDVEARTAISSDVFTSRSTSILHPI